MLQYIQGENMDMVEEKKGIKKKLIIAFIIFISLISSILLYSRFIGTSGLVIKEYKIKNTKLPTSFYGLKIIHISDIHYGRTIGIKEFSKIVEEINLRKPDIVVFTGDLFDNNKSLTKEDVKDITEGLKKINAKIGKFAITGEHDFKRDEWSTIIKDSGFTNLNDTYELIYKDGYEPIMIAGLSTNLKGTKNAKDKIAPINDYIHSIKESEEINIPHFKILLLHEPDYINDITYKNYDLILAGHSHNGQITIPFIGAIIKPKGAQEYFDEYYTLDNTELYISSGLGTAKLDFRLFNRPSINFYRIVNK